MHTDEPVIEVDDELIEEFFSEFNEVYVDLESNLVQLESAPDNKDLINGLFRNIHSVKSNLRMIGFGSVSDFVHILENLLDDIRDGRLSYNAGLSDVILLSIDRVKALCEGFFNDEDLGQSVSDIEAALQRICLAKPDAYQAAIVHAVRLLDAASAAPTGDATSAAEKAPLPPVPEGVQVTPSAGIANEGDLDYFRRLALMLDSKQPFWQGRTQRLLQLVQAMNQWVGHVLDPEQLEAAVYLHDIGMSFLPDTLTERAGELTDEDFALLKTHPDLGYALAKRMGPWQDTAVMVRQHHERVDGRGYPKQLSGDQIHPGAQMLAIADTFEAMTQSRATRDHQRPFMRAILEINNCDGSQFSHAWVEAFNNIVRSLKKVG